MRFDGPLGSIRTNPTPPPKPAMWTRTWPEKDARLAAIEALLNSAPDDQPAHVTLAAIRNVIEGKR